MNCATARRHLPALLYDGLPSHQTETVRRHLAECLGCRTTFAELEQVRQALDAVSPTPALAVDLPQLFAEAARRQERRLRWWRRTAVALGAAAALLLVAIGLLQLEVRFEGHQFVVRWGQPPAPVPDVAPPVVVQTPPAVSPDDVQLLRDLVVALEADVRSRDQKQQHALAQLRSRLDALQDRSDQRWADAERTQRAFYTALFGPRNAQGVKP